jgi:hypothetical protein
MPDIRTATKRLLEAVKRTLKDKAMQRVIPTLEKGIGLAFKRQGQLYVKRFGKLKEKWPLEEAVSDDAGDLFDGLDTSDLFLAPLAAAIETMLQMGALSLLAQLGLDLSFDLKNPRAVEYLKEHGAELVKKIDEVTRGQLQYIVEYGVENGWSYTQTAAAIQAQFKDYYTGNSWWNFDSPRPQGHIDSRAHLIAITESGNAYEAGNYAAAQDLVDAGIKIVKFWSTIGDDRVSDGCAENEGAGWIPFEDTFPSGDLHPLRFPGCRCALLTEMEKP